MTGQPCLSGPVVRHGCSGSIWSGKLLTLRSEEEKEPDRGLPPFSRECPNHPKTSHLSLPPKGSIASHAGWGPVFNTLPLGVSEIQTVVTCYIIFGMQQSLKSCQMCDQEKDFSENAPLLQQIKNQTNKTKNSNPPSNKKPRKVSNTPNRVVEKSLVLRCLWRYGKCSRVTNMVPKSIL